MGLVGATPTESRPSPAPPPQSHHTTKSYKCFYLPQRVGVPQCGSRGSSDRMREAGEPSTWRKLQECSAKCCARPPGIVMVSPPTIPRNASRAQSEGRDPVGPRPASHLRGYCSVAWLDP